jgi:hypothetical protein
MEQRKSKETGQTPNSHQYVIYMLDRGENTTCSEALTTTVAVQTANGRRFVQTKLYWYLGCWGYSSKDGIDLSCENQPDVDCEKILERLMFKKSNSF